MRLKKLSENLQRTNYAAHQLDLYRQAARDVQARSSGIERYVIDIFGPDLMASWALAFDPYRQFYNLPRQVSLLTDGDKIVRTRTIETQPRSNRIESWKRRNILTSYYRNPQAGTFDYVSTGPRYSESKGTVDRGQQPPLYGIIRDTTRRTRPIKHTGGEFEYFAPKLPSRSRDHTFKRQDILNFNSIGTGQRVHDESWTTSNLVGPEFATTNAQVQALLPFMRTRAVAAMQQNVMAMLNRVQPRRKTYDLFYQLAELRELPRTLQGTLQSWIAFERLIGTNFFRNLLRSPSRWGDHGLLSAFQRTLGRETNFAYKSQRSLAENAGSAFLTFKFGWESTVRGVVEFLPSPARVTREINTLIDSIGRDRTFRTKKFWIENEASFPSFTYRLLKDESANDPTLRTEGLRKCELRLAVNYRIQFPQLDLPRLRQELFRRKIGIEPSPTDLYNLIPWTWLADWFSGAGDYLQLLDSVAGDESLINYGFITYREDGDTTASLLGKFTHSVRRTINGVVQDSSYDQPFRHQGRFTYAYQLRRSIPTIASVKSIWDPNLGPSQQAIMGALLATRSGSAARRDAS